MFVTYELEKSVGVKPWKMAFTWFPFPIKEPRIRPSIGDAVLIFFHLNTGGSIVQRASFCTDPFATGVVTWILINWRRRSGKRRVVGDGDGNGDGTENIIFWR